MVFDRRAASDPPVPKRGWSAPKLTRPFSSSAMISPSSSSCALLTVLARALISG